MGKRGWFYSGLVGQRHVPGDWCLSLRLRMTHWDISVFRSPLGAVFSTSNHFTDFMHTLAMELIWGKATEEFLWWRSFSCSIMENTPWWIAFRLESISGYSVRIQLYSHNFSHHLLCINHSKTGDIHILRLHNHSWTQEDHGHVECVYLYHWWLLSVWHPMWSISMKRTWETKRRQWYNGVLDAILESYGGAIANSLCSATG